MTESEQNLEKFYIRGMSSREKIKRIKKGKKNWMRKERKNNEKKDEEKERMRMKEKECRMEA